MPILGSPLWMVLRNTSPEKLTIHLEGELQNERTEGDRVHKHMPEGTVQTECSEDLPREAQPIREGFLEEAEYTQGYLSIRRRAEARGPRCLNL